MSQVASNSPSENALNEENSFEHMLPLLSAVTQFRHKLLQDAGKFVGSLGTDWANIKRAETERNQRENHHYSPLRSITIKETDHSKLLGGLLDPYGAHGQGRLFLNSFLDLLGFEKPTEGTWKISIEDDHIDILLRRTNPPSVIIIENKANDAVDQRGQLYRYWFKKIYRAYPKLDYHDPTTARCFKIVYAPSLSFCRPAADSTKRPSDLADAPAKYPTLPLPVDYLYFELDVAPWLERMAEEVKSARLKIFLKLYAEIWKV